MEKNCEIVARPRNLREMIQSAWFWNPVRFVLIGGMAGYLYYHFTIDSGSTSDFFSDPIRGVLSGAFLGFFYAIRPCKSC